MTIRRNSEQLVPLTANSSWQVGLEVSGLYCNQPYRGVLTEFCRPTPDGRNVIFNVQLHEPITVFDMTRRRLDVFTGDKSDTIFVAGPRALDCEDTGASEVFTGHLNVGDVHIQADFAAPIGATDAAKDLAFLNALSEKVDISYLSIGIARN